MSRQEFALDAGAEPRAVAGLAADVSDHCDSPNHVNLAPDITSNRFTCKQKGVEKEWKASGTERKQVHKVNGISLFSSPLAGAGRAAARRRRKQRR